MHEITKVLRRQRVLAGDVPDRKAGLYILNCPVLVIRISLPYYRSHQNLRRSKSNAIFQN